MFGFGEHDVSTGWAVTVGVIVGMTLWVVLAARALRVARVVPQVLLSPGAVVLVGRVAAREPIEKGQAFDLTLREGTSIRVVPTRRALITTRGARSWERGAFSPGDWVRAEGMLSGTEHDGYRAREWTLEAVEVTHLSSDPRVRSRFGPALALVTGALSLVWFFVTAAPFVAVSVFGHRASGTGEIVAIGERPDGPTLIESEQYRVFLPQGEVTLIVRVDVDDASPAWSFLDEISAARADDFRAQRHLPLLVAEVAGMRFAQLGATPGLSKSVARWAVTELVLAAIVFALVRRRS